MIREPRANDLARPYRGLSVQDASFSLDERSIAAALLGREAYRRTEYLLLRRGGESALVAVEKESTEPLFSPITEVRVLAGPDAVVEVESPQTNVANATALAAVAAAHRTPRAKAYAVTGQYQHVNFIWMPQPITIRVLEVTPPFPPKLLGMAQQCVDFDEELPPIELVGDVVDLTELIERAAAEHPLLPCRGSGMDAMGYVDFLDTRPAHRAGWTLVGCERSEAFYEHFYGEQPRRVDICPRQRRPAGDGLVLAKCCLREFGIGAEGGRVEVAWGASIEEVRQALHVLAAAATADQALADAS